MSKRRKNRLHRRRKIVVGPAPIATITTPVAVQDMPTLLLSYVDADGSTHLILLSKKFAPVRLLNLMRKNRAMYAAGTPAVLRTRLLEQALRQDLNNPAAYAPFLRHVSYQNGLNGYPLLHLQMTEFGFKSLATWFAYSTDSMMNVKAEDLHKFDDKLKRDFSDELLHALKMLKYL